MNVIIGLTPLWILVVRLFYITHLNLEQSWNGIISSCAVHFIRTWPLISIMIGGELYLVNVVFLPFSLMQTPLHNKLPFILRCLTIHSPNWWIYYTWHFSNEANPWCTVTLLKMLNTKHSVKSNCDFHIIIWSFAMVSLQTHHSIRILRRYVELKIISRRSPDE